MCKYKWGWVTLEFQHQNILISLEVFPLKQSTHKEHPLLPSVGVGAEASQNRTSHTITFEATLWHRLLHINSITPFFWLYHSSRAGFSWKSMKLKFQSPSFAEGHFKALKETLAVSSWSYGLVKFATDILIAIDSRVLFLLSFPPSHFSYMVTLKQLWANFGSDLKEMRWGYI